MNYLTRISLGRSQAASMRLADAYAWHQKLWEAFPDRDGEKRNFLFRIDDAGQDFRVLLLSGITPTPPQWGHWSTKSVAESFLQHPNYRFQIRANPTMRRSKDGKRLGIYQENRLREWICRKAQINGFAILEESLTVGAPIDEFFRKNGKRGQHVSVDFRGLLSVTEYSAFAKAFQTGIGSAKAFGFGMLMLEPI